MESTSLSESGDYSAPEVFKTSSNWSGVASERALLNAPLYKQSCSDTGRRIHKNHDPINSSTFHRNKLFKTQKPQEGLVVNTTSCCYFGNFVKGKHSWKTCFL